MIEGSPTDLPGVVVVAPVVHGDDRGFFYESWNARDFAAATGQDLGFVQDNHSRSAAGVLRGMHYQLPPHPQGKLVRVTAGAAYDVAVDIRRSSPTFRRWFGIELSAENKLQLWIPPGFAHGFLALTDVELQYKTTDFYDGAADRAIRWDDPELGIDWPIDGEPILSAKDAGAASLAAADLFD